jgi:maltodextrin utilization protein YvdJ
MLNPGPFEFLGVRVRCSGAKVLALYDLLFILLFMIVLRIGPLDVRFPTGFVPIS